MFYHTFQKRVCKVFLINVSDFWLTSMTQVQAQAFSNCARMRPKQVHGIWTEVAGVFAMAQIVKCRFVKNESFGMSGEYSATYLGKSNIRSEIYRECFQVISRFPSFSSQPSSLLVATSIRL